MKYFTLTDDIDFPERWHLGAVVNQGDGRLVRPPMIAMNDPLRSKRYRIDLQVPGQAMDYTTTSQAEVPIISFKALSALSGTDGFSAFPAHVLGFTARTSFHVLHVWDEADCVDEDQSKFQLFLKDDPVRPDLAGQYRAFFKLVIDADRAGGKHLFRLARSNRDLIVSEVVKTRLENARVTGAVFHPVN